MAQKSGKDLVEQRGTVKPPPPPKPSEEEPRSIKGVATPTKQG